MIVNQQQQVISEASRNIQLSNIRIKEIEEAIKELEDEKRQSIESFDKMIAEEKDFASAEKIKIRFEEIKKIDAETEIERATKVKSIYEELKNT